MRKICLIMILSISLMFFCQMAFCAFIVNGDGTVTDTSTGLMWQQATTGPRGWELAIKYCESLSLAGHDDWRLPNINELQSIVDYSVYDPAVDTSVFPNTQLSRYWSSTIVAGISVNAWLINFSSGSVSSSLNSNSYYVRAVRGGDRLLSDLIISVADGVSGNPVVRANVLITETNMVIDPITGMSSPNGWVTFSDLPLGSYDIEITAGGFLPFGDTIVIAVTQPGMFELTVKMQRGHALFGKVINADTKRPLSNVKVSIDRGTSTFTNQQGEFLFKRLNPGIKSIVFSKAGFHSTILKKITVIHNDWMKINAALVPE